MQKFSIKDLETLSGIKAHTIRMWEQRYNLLKPQRTATNIRFYSGEDLRLLLNVSLLCKMGYRISKVAGMSKNQMHELIAENANLENEQIHLLNILKIAMLNYDELLFNNVMDRFLSEHDVEQAFKGLFIPFLTQVGLLWQTNSICPAQEHFVSNLIRQKVYAYIDSLPVGAGEKEKSFVLFLPENELHDLGLLMLHYVFRFAGYHTIFLGQSVPLADLQQVQEKLGPVTFISYITSSSTTKGIGKYITHIVEAFTDSGCTFHLTGAAVENFKSPRKDLISIYNTAEDILEALV